MEKMLALNIVTEIVSCVGAVELMVQVLRGHRQPSSSISYLKPFQASSGPPAITVH